MSANSAVTVLRSPSSASGELLSGPTRTRDANPSGAEVAGAVPVALVSGAPHLPQKSEVDGFSALHFAQCLASAFPHLWQKLLVEGLFVPHVEQRIDAPTRTKRPTAFVSSEASYGPAGSEGATQRAPLRVKHRWLCLEEDGAMRGEDQQSGMFSYVSTETRAPRSSAARDPSEDACIEMPTE